MTKKPSEESTFRLSVREDWAALGELPKAAATHDELLKQVGAAAEGKVSSDLAARVAKILKLRKNDFRIRRMLTAWQASHVTAQFYLDALSEAVVGEQKAHQQTERDRKEQVRLREQAQRDLDAANTENKRLVRWLAIAAILIVVSVLVSWALPWPWGFARP